MEERNKGLIIFGIILLVIGLVASFYSQREYEPIGFDYSMIYPYQNVGIILLVAGIVFIALGFLYSPWKEMSERKDKALLLLISVLFWIFLAVTIFFIIYVALIPTPTEWGIVTGKLKRNDTGDYVPVPNAPSFPNNFTVENLWNAVIRHLAVFPEHINSSFLITALNFAFLTMFVRNIGKTVEEQLKPNGEGIVKMSIYVEWAMGSLISGILFFSSSINTLDLNRMFIFIAAIVIFALVSYFVLYRLRTKLIDEEHGEKTKEGKEEALIKMKNQNGKLRVTDD